MLFLLHERQFLSFHSFRVIRSVRIFSVAFFLGGRYLRKEFSHFDGFIYFCLIRRGNAPCTERVNDFNEISLLSRVCLFGRIYKGRANTGLFRMKRRDFDFDGPEIGFLMLLSWSQWCAWRKKLGFIFNLKNTRETRKNLYCCEDLKCLEEIVIR